MPHTSNNKELNNSLDRVMNFTTFNYRGVLINNTRTGWECLGEHFTRWDEVDKKIDRSINSISQSIKKASQ